MSFDTELSNVIKTAAKSLHENEKFAVPILAARASRAAQENPYDASVVMASNVLKKMANDQTFITRKDLNNLYDKLYNQNTKLGELFAEELDRQTESPVRMFRRDESEEKPLEHDYVNVADPFLSNALTAAFDGKESRLFSKKAGEKAARACAHELEAIGLPANKVEVFAGKSDMIVCQASYDTPKGQAHVLVPVEINDEAALLPSMFLSRAGFVELEADNLVEHVKSTAGNSFKVDGEKLLEVLAAAQYGVAEGISDVDLAVMAMKADAETPATYTPDGIVYQQVDVNAHAVQDEQEPQTEEHISFAKRLASPTGVAEQIFGKTAVVAGRNMIKRQLGKFGFKDVQVSVFDNNENTVFYAVGIDHRGGLKVPVKIDNGLALPPTMVLGSDQIDSFNAAGISRLMAHGTDSRMLAVASPLYGTKPSELMQQVHKGIAEGNMSIVEDAIDVLGEVDAEAQKRAIALVMESFNPDTLKKVASEQKGCSRIVKHSSSQHPMCGHLNLPLHKVYQDKYGDCQPLYRKNIEETNEAGNGIFMTNKIFF